MEDRDWAISTCGEGIYTYDDTLLDELEDKCISKLSDNDYFGACKSLIRQKIYENQKVPRLTSTMSLGTFFTAL